MTLAPPPSSRVQLTDDGKLRHFLSVEHLSRSLLEDMLDRDISYVFDDARLGDQLVYVSDIRKAKMLANWAPATEIRKGLVKLVNWVQENESLLRH